MAKQISSNRQIIEREKGDACPRPECRGTLSDVIGKHEGDPVVQCSGCSRLFDKTYTLPANETNRVGRSQNLTIPEPVQWALAKSLFDKDEEQRNPNPPDRRDWTEMSQGEANDYQERAMAALLPVWPDIGEWFEAYTFTVEQGRAALNAVREIAVPSLKYCEDKYGHDDQARLNLEAAIREA